MGNSSPRNEFEKRWQRRFAEFAQLKTDDAGVAGWSSSGLETRFRRFTSLWRGAESGALFVDLGCGAGTYSRWMADASLRVIGIDYSHPSLLIAKRKEPSRVSYCAADASQLPFPDHSIDGVLCFGVLQAVWESEPFVREIARVLVPGGEVWIDALNAQGMRALWDTTERRLRGKSMHLRYESPKALIALMHRFGFRDLKRHWLPILPGKFSSLQAILESRLATLILNILPPFGTLLSHSFIIHARTAMHEETPPNQAAI